MPRGLQTREAGPDGTLLLQMIDIVTGRPQEPHLQTMFELGITPAQFKRTSPSQIPPGEQGPLLIGQSILMLTHLHPIQRLQARQPAPQPGRKAEADHH